MAVGAGVAVVAGALVAGGLECGTVLVAGGLVVGALEGLARAALRGSRVRSTLALGVVVKVFAVHASSLQLTDALAILGTTLI